MDCATFVFDAIRHEIHSSVAVGNTVEHSAVRQCGAVEARTRDKIIPTPYLFTDCTASKIVPPLGTVTFCASFRLTASSISARNTPTGDQLNL